ncbi:MAG: endonuclease [Cypionkella sp.]
MVSGSMLRASIIIAISMLVSAASSQDKATSDAFWAHVAPLTPALYCAADVATIRATNAYSMEHVYPKSWMRQTLQCGSSKRCDRDTTFRAWAGDMQNLMPADRAMNTARGDRAFAELEPRDDWRGLSCFRSRGMDIAGTIKTDGIVEPRNEDKGDIARILLYVHDVYGGRLPDGQLEVIARWMVVDPVSPAECARQEAIHALQETWNAYVVCPAG